MPDVKIRSARSSPLTAAILALPRLCPFEERPIRVDDTGAVHTEERAPVVDIAVDVDPKEVRDHLMETWLTGG